jgi:hypothetical protein
MANTFATSAERFAVSGSSNAGWDVSDACVLWSQAHFVS